MWHGASSLPFCCASRTVWGGFLFSVKLADNTRGPFYTPTPESQALHTWPGRRLRCDRCACTDTAVFRCHKGCAISATLSMCRGWKHCSLLGKILFLCHVRNASYRRSDFTCFLLVSVVLRYSRSGYYFSMEHM